MSSSQSLTHQPVQIPLLKEKNIRLYVKRLDLISAGISGNKWFKLKYNLKEAKKQGITIYEYLNREVDSLVVANKLKRRCQLTARYHVLP